jgi:hypothetical protein
MESHTVPRKLLDQFAYDDAKTRARRLWQYAKDREPWWKASPRTATRVSGHFADPEDSEREAKLEMRLNDEFENPVHCFIDQMRYRTFVLSRLHIRHLTRYVTLLFNRSEARRGATKQQIDVGIESLQALTSDEEKLGKIAARWTFDILKTHPLQTIVTIDDVRQSGIDMIERMRTANHEQTTYVDSMERAMAFLDEQIDGGQWNMLYVDPSTPFVIGDAPVVTWERQDSNVLTYGMGFSRPNVEVILPVAPNACIHLLPLVHRTRQTRPPTVREVNQAQSWFSTRYCYANVNNAELNQILQPHFGKSKMGINTFSVRHRNYTDTMFNLLMSGGRDFSAPSYCAS